VKRLQKGWEDAETKRGDVAREGTGVSGRAMLTALCRGETDAEALADLARGACQAKDPSCKALCHRIAARRGSKRALVAGARAILGVLDHGRLYPEPYRQLGEGDLDEPQREDPAKPLTPRRRKRGYDVSLTAVAA
jgi:hypothetical protein